MKPVLVIPARFKSSRFEGKPLVPIKGVPMIYRVWQRCVGALPEKDVYVATDDDRIRSYCESVGIQVIMTPDDCLTGTDRVYHASLKVEGDIFINVQGDEPLLEPSDIMAVVEMAQANTGSVINAMCPILEERDFRSKTVPKVVARMDGRLLYMSRGAIPTTKGHEFVTAKKQVCIYAFPREALNDFASRKSKTPLESIEDIEILRLLELGYEVQMVEVSGASVAVDTPEDVSRVEALLAD